MSIRKENRHPTTLFRVQVFGKSSQLNEEIYCIGTNDIDRFIQSKREELGLENYSGYSTQAVNLTSFTESVIILGVSKSI
tara:strand:+ start:329 stop:568 length:240 start_codon:yes stop_codon:yes gene_type:complete